MSRVDANEWRERNIECAEKNISSKTKLRLVSIHFKFISVFMRIFLAIKSAWITKPTTKNRKTSEFLSVIYLVRCDVGFQIFSIFFAVDKKKLQNPETSWVLFYIRTHKTLNFSWMNYSNFHSSAHHITYKWK